MSKEIMYGIVGFIVGAALAGLFVMYTTQSKTIAPQIAQEGADTNMHGMMGHDMNSMSMGDMNKELDGKTGEDFDKAFIEMMIPHHQGAIDMAELALKNAGHSEIKNLAKEIIKAQKSEIKMMSDWQTLWGY